MSATSRVSVLLPFYKEVGLLSSILEQLSNQTYSDLEILIQDDSGDDEISRLAIEVVTECRDTRLRYQKNERNVGYARNLARLFQRANGQFIVLAAQDDIFPRDLIERYVELFDQVPTMGVITRSYYWFDSEPSRPVRVVRAFEDSNVTVGEVSANPDFLIKVIESIGQLSGLAFRRSHMVGSLSGDVFTAHIEPFLKTCLKHECGFINIPCVAVGIRHSQTRHRPDIYETSPTLTWLQMFERVFSEQPSLHKVARNYIANQPEALPQIACSQGRGASLREIQVQRSASPEIFHSPRYFLIAATCLILPRFLLRRLVDLYKSRVVARNARKYVISPYSEGWILGPLTF